MIGSRMKMVASGLGMALLATIGTVVPLTSSALATAPSETSVIAKSAYGDVNAIRNYFFCVSATCKKNRTANEVAAGKAMNALASEAIAVAEHAIPAHQKAIVKKFVHDVGALSSAYIAYPKQSSAEAIARNTASIYYQTANVGSDAYVLSVALSGGSIRFSRWCVGAVAVLYAMQLDTQALNAKSATVADDIYASQNLENEAIALNGDANGPSSTFNTLLSTFATTQLSVSSNELDILEHKKTSLSTSAISALSKKLSEQFTKIVTAEKSLAKK